MIKSTHRWLFCLLLLGIILGLVSCSGVGGNKSVSPLNLKEILSYSVQGPGGDAFNGVITGNSIVVIMPYGGHPDHLVSTFTTTGEYVTVGNFVQISGVTRNNLAKPVTYTVHAIDGSTQNYIVRVKFELIPFGGIVL